MIKTDNVVQPVKVMVYNIANQKANSTHKISSFELLNYMIAKLIMSILIRYL